MGGAGEAAARVAALVREVITRGAAPERAPLANETRLPTGRPKRARRVLSAEVGAVMGRRIAITRTAAAEPRE